MELESNNSARRHWNSLPVGSQRSSSIPGSYCYFQDLRNYRYGYETPFIPRVFRFDDLKDKSVLEIGVGNGIDAVEMIKNGAAYTGLDITDKHLELAKEYCELSDCAGIFIKGDLIHTPLDRKFDVIYSFGVLHHIQHDNLYLEKIVSCLKSGGELRLAVYSKFSFFNCFMFLTWILKNRCKSTLSDWQSHTAELTPLGKPVTIKVRSKSEVLKWLKPSQLKIVSYQKAGFSQGNLPFVGRYLKPDGSTLRFLGSWLGWYHCFRLQKVSDEFP